MSVGRLAARGETPTLHRDGRGCIGYAQSAIAGVVTDTTGAVLPGVGQASVNLRLNEPGSLYYGRVNVADETEMAGPVSDSGEDGDNGFTTE